MIDRRALMIALIPGLIIAILLGMFLPGSSSLGPTRSSGTVVIRQDVAAAPVGSSGAFGQSGTPSGLLPSGAVPAAGSGNPVDAGVTGAGSVAGGSAAVPGGAGGGGGSPISGGGASTRPVGASAAPPAAPATATPVPVPTASPVRTPAPTPAPTPARTPEPTPQPTPEPTPDPTPTATPTPEPTSTGLVCKLVPILCP